MDKIAQMFEGIIRRGIAPSVTFLVIAVAGDYLRLRLGVGSVWVQLVEYQSFIPPWLYRTSDSVFISLIVVGIIGLSYALMALQQVLFDNRLRKNFRLPGPHQMPWQSSDVKALDELRKKVRSRLSNEKISAELSTLNGTAGVDTDYLLYEIIGGIDTTDTRSFVDTAKAVGIFFVSIILVLGLNAWAITLHYGAGGLVTTLLLMLVFYGLGWATTASQYRARALRLYVNFLSMPPERIQLRLLGLSAEQVLAIPGDGVAAKKVAAGNGGVRSTSLQLSASMNLGSLHGSRHP